jgi:ribose/xylose/arabinose/galactoside ABC-type transport system permease subunit
MRAIQLHGREIGVAFAIALLNLALIFSGHRYFTAENLSDLLLANMPVLIISLGMMLVILTGRIDISVGSQFAVCSVIAGVSARSGLPGAGVALAACLAGALFGAVNGGLVAYLRVPSIVVTLATMIALRDGLRWLTQGSWVGDLPASFQWFHLSQRGYTAGALALAVLFVGTAAFGLRYLRAGRAVFATGSSESSSRMVGIRTERVVFSVFTLTGALAGLAAALNSVRFHQVPSNAGLGLEMKVIAAVVVGGTAITGGSGTVAGTVLGVILLGSIGTGLTFLGVSAYWENAIQGFIILVAVAINLADRKRG